MSELTLCYVHNTHMGYGRLGVGLADALALQGVDVYDHLGDGPDLGRNESEVAIAEGYRQPERPTNAVCWVSTPSHAKWWWEGQHATVFTMWEASVLPPTFRESLHELDMLVVPSEHNLELFSKYHSDVRYVPLGVDTDQWHYTRRRESLFFDFLIGGSGPRKGTDLAHKAFINVFGDYRSGSGRIPRLVMKNPRGEAQFRGWDRVEMVPGRLSDDEEIALYETAAVYLQPSRGEGFGLQPLQAMAQGIPTILTDAHGHASFAKYGIPLDWEWKPADYFIFGDAGDWWEPDFEQLCETMWDCYHNYDQRLAEAEVVALTVIPYEFSWKAAAQRFLREFRGLLDTPYHGDGSHHVPERKLYRVRTLGPRPHKALALPQGEHIWMPGKDYYEVADTKRLLFESQVLDPECLQGDDHGLAPQQVAQLGAYSASKEWCPTCRQRLGSGESLIDVIEAQMAAP